MTFLLKLSTALEQRANEIKQEALDLLSAALAMTSTQGFLDVLSTAFNYYSPPDPTHPPTEDEEDEDQDDLPQEGVLEEGEEPDEAQASSSKSSKSGTKRKIEGQGKLPPPKSTKADMKEEVPKYDICSADITLYYPTTSENSAHRIGVSDRLRQTRKAYKGGHFRYWCKFVELGPEDGHVVTDEDKECDYWCQQASQITTHIRKCHLGYALGCKICDYRTYSGQTWLKHMNKRHSSRKEEWFATIKDEVLQGSHFELGAEVNIDEVLADAGKH